MSYTKCGDITWSSSSPKITGTIYYDHSRSGADMQYKVKIVLDKLPYADSEYGFNIYASVSLDGKGKVSGHQIKGNGAYASGGYTYETNWLTVSGKTSGTTSLSVEIYTTSDPDRIDKKYEYTLTVEPAASDIDSASNINTGSAVNVKWKPWNKNFTFNLSFKIGSKTIKSVTGIKPGSTSQYEYTGYTIPHSEVPDAASSNVTVTLETYSGSTRVGTATKTFTASVPSSIVPTVGNLAVSAVNDKSVLGTVFAAGLSKAQWSCTVSPGDGASIKEIEFVFAGSEQKGTASNGTTNAIARSGSYTPSVTVTDSRGRKATVTGSNIEVLPYLQPSVSGASVERCDSLGRADGEGTYLGVKAMVIYSDVGGKNTATLRVRSRSAGGSWSGYTTISAGILNVLGTFAIESSYEVEISVIDTVGNSGLPLTFIVPTSEVALHLRPGGKGAAFGKYSEKEALECAWDAEFDKDVSVDGRLTIAGLTIDDFPIERGVSGIWTYKKMASGDAECWLTDGHMASSVPTSMTANGALYESNVMTLALPDGLFVSAPNVSIDVQQGGGMFFKATGDTSKDNITYEMLRTNNTKAAARMSVQCKGKWK